MLTFCVETGVVPSLLAGVDVNPSFLMLRVNFSPYMVF